MQIFYNPEANLRGETSNKYQVSSLGGQEVNSLGYTDIAVPVPVDYKPLEPVSNGTITAATGGPTVTSGASGMLDAVGINWGNVFGGLDDIGSPSAPTAEQSGAQSATGFWLVALLAGAAVIWALKG